MRSSTFEPLTSALLACAVSTLAFGCDAQDIEEQAPVARADAPAKLPARTASPTASPATSVATSAAPIDAAAPEAAPILASAASSGIERSTAPTAAPSAAPTTKRVKHTLRDPSLLPAGTPTTHAEAFANLPVGKRDKAPVAGVGASGIHLDEIAVGKGWASSRCEELGDRFVPGVDDRINVCFRVVHPREAETVTMQWARDGKVRQVIDLHVADSRAYRTRAWMPVTEGRAGTWTATVKSEDGSVLGMVEFEVAAD